MATVIPPGRQPWNSKNSNQLFNIQDNDRSIAIEDLTFDDWVLSRYGYRLTERSRIDPLSVLRFECVCVRRPWSQGFCLDLGLFTARASLDSVRRKNHYQPGCRRA